MVRRPWTWESPRAGSCPTLATNYVPLGKIFNILMSQKSPGFLTTHTEKVKAVRKKKKKKPRASLNLYLFYSIIHCFSNSKLGPLGGYDINLEDHESYFEKMK